MLGINAYGQRQSLKQILMAVLQLKLWLWNNDNCWNTNQYGFATLAAIGMGWFIYFICVYITREIKTKLSQMNGVLIGLIDRIRMLDNDLIRLRSKLNTILTIRENQKKKKEK